MFNVHSNSKQFATVDTFASETSATDTDDPKMAQKITVVVMKCIISDPLFRRFDSAD